LARIHLSGNRVNQAVAPAEKFAIVASFGAGRNPCSFQLVEREIRRGRPSIWGNSFDPRSARCERAGINLQPHEGSTETSTAAIVSGSAFEFGRFNYTLLRDTKSVIAPEVFTMVADMALAV
jgi:hypothetical protein